MHAVPKRRTSTKRKAGPAWRFLRALFLSAATAFGAGTYAINSGALARLDWRVPPAAAPAAAPAGELVQTRFTACRQFFPNGNAPVVPASGRLRELCFDSFAVLHDGRTKTPVFVAERLNRQTLARAAGQERTDSFYAEARLPRAERAELSDYRGSGYSRGHMVPAANMATERAMAQSFSLANMVPQNPAQNSGPWSRIEEDTRKYVRRAGGDVYVFTGPVYSDRPRTIGDGVAVPSHVYKVVYDAVTGRAWVHWQPNDARAKVGPPIGYDEFVRRTGLRLLPGR
ncbi:DNA/RNA non-specific endonuclease [Bordetella genomosp. 13]|uniref:Endonuclease n=1 Tax=Bordetella genomosp. 13 TaxID=463040 RepID=A0A1W6ZFC1_9BORD|nr:DNA/RNA non-specific endonuclease [Bordetella genomosp. 13]ARP96029.1 endonuclease [Bordetella genomosp. 13]